MKQENFLFVDLLSSVFLIALLLGNMFGLLYITDGNIAISLIVSLIIVICYYFILQTLKRNKEYLISKNFMAFPSVFFLVFLLFGVASFFFINHFWTVETNHKEAIRQDADNKIENIQSLIKDYDARANDDLQTFEGKLTTLLNQYKSTNSPSLRNQLAQDPFLIDEKVLSSPAYIKVPDVVNSNLEPVRNRLSANKKGYSDVFSADLKNFKSSFDNWNRLTVMKSYKDLNAYYEKAGIFLNQKFAELPFSKQQVALIKSKQVAQINDPVVMFKESKDFWIPLLFVLVTHLFILIPYFTYRVRKYKNNTSSGEGKVSGGISI